jgi:hypothetical protein
MRKKNLFLIGLFFSVISINAQVDLNAYKYVTVPNRFDFQNSEDAFQLNSLLKFLFNKKGFEAVLNNETMPFALRANPCLGVLAKVVNESSMFKTKVFIELYNCHNQVVLKTEIGESKEKDLKKGFQEAIRLAFKTIEDLSYNYADNKQIVDVDVIPEKKIAPQILKLPIQKEELVLEEKSILEPPTTNVIADQKYQEKVVVIAENVAKIKTSTIEGMFASATKTIAIAKQGNQYIVSDKQQNVIGILYPTSQANYFIVKWLQSDDSLPKLVYFNEEGDLIIDSVKSTDKYKGIR